MAAEFGFALLGPLALYALISAETADLPVMNRDAAERFARRDVDSEGGDEREGDSD